MGVDDALLGGALEESAAVGMGDLNAMKAIGGGGLSGGADVDGGDFGEGGAEAVPA